MERLFQSLRILPRWIILSIDSVILLFSVSLAYLLVFDFQWETVQSHYYVPGVSVYFLCNIVAILFTQSYAGIVRYTSIQDGLRIVYTIAIGALLTVCASFVNLFFADIRLVPISIVIISAFHSIIFLFSYRLLVKYLFGYFTSPYKKKTNVIIFGAGNSGLNTKQIIDNNHTSHIRVVAFIEDNPQKVGKVIDGVKIFDAKNDLVKVIQDGLVDELIIAIQNLSLKRKNEIVDACLQHKVKVRHIPPVENWVKGELSLNQIRDINIEDLLGRDSIKIDNLNVRSELVGKTVLISGAAGSIGSEMVRQALSYKPEMLVLLDQSETGLYEIEQEISQVKSITEVCVVIADICNKVRVDNVFNTYKPDIVFHAAAYKHVPLMENNPAEAVYCNVAGTKVLADTSVKHKVKKFVMISTDKAVNPTSVMGASKRIAEMYVQSLNNFLNKDKYAHTSFITTRFGNVLGSNGSVIPLFKKQIEAGTAVTVTHPEITRYFMTIPEACQLVLEAGAMGKGGEIFIFDMGESIKIVDLAKKMIRLSGLQLGKDIDINFIGLRDGEKLYEELLTNEENTIPTHHNKILIAKVKEEDYNEVSSLVEELVDKAYIRDDLKTVGLMKYIVPEFKSNISRFEILDKDKVKIIQ